MHVMRALLLPLVLVMTSPCWAEPGAQAWLDDLGSEAALVREQAFRHLLDAKELEAAAVRVAFVQAPEEARPLLLELIASRLMTDLTPLVVDAVVGADPETAEAAVRTLVTLGDASVEHGRLRLASATKTAPHLVPRATRLEALTTQAAVERDILARWRRKGGSYEGRFDALETHGWASQPVLLAMLLDVPLEDRFVVLPQGLSKLRLLISRIRALRDLASSQRRGYQTFRPLPVGIDHEDLFELSAQALLDVGDMDLMGDTLEELAIRLNRADARAGFQLRPVERHMAEAMEEILAVNGRPELLKFRATELRSRADASRRWAERSPPERAAQAKQWYATDLRRLAGVLHRLRDFEGAETTYRLSIDVSQEIGGDAPAVAIYNLACALARGGKPDEALVQLDISLKTDISDLTREWVAEDGDLRSLHDDERFAKILDRYFGEEQ